MVFASINIPFIGMVLLMPESPVFLVSKNKLEEAHQVLRRLRGKNWNVSLELTELKKSTEGYEKPPSTKKTGIEEIFVPHIIKPVIIAFLLMFFFQTSGINLVLTYAPQIFADVTNIDKFLANIFLGCALFASNTVTLFVAGKLPRRTMLLISSFGCSLTLAVMGFSYKIIEWEQNCINSSSVLNATLAERTVDCSYNLNWLPVVDSMIFIFVFNLGYGSIIWMTVLEILPLHIRNLLNGYD